LGREIIALAKFAENENTYVRFVPEKAVLLDEQS
jgi:hypothetical protein